MFFLWQVCVFALVKSISTRPRTSKVLMNNCLINDAVKRDLMFLNVGNLCMPGARMSFIYFVNSLEHTMEGIKE